MENVAAAYARAPQHFHQSPRCLHVARVNAALSKSFALLWKNSLPALLWTRKGAALSSGATTRHLRVCWKHYMWLCCPCTRSAAAPQLRFLSCARRSTAALWFPRVTAHGSRPAALIGLQSQGGVQGKRRTKDRVREFCFQTGEPAVNVRLSVLRNAKVAKRMWPNTLGVASWCKPHFSPHNVPHTLHAVQMCAVVTVMAAKLLFLVVASCCSVRWDPCTSYWPGRVIIIIHGG